MLKVAGVTFANEKENGGRNRQEILKELVASGKEIITVDLVNTTYEGEPAVKIIEHSTREMIGWLPKELVGTTQHSQMTGFIDKGKRGYSVRIDEQKKPTQAQYHAVKNACAKRGIPAPAYDVRAYYSIFAMTDR